MRACENCGRPGTKSVEGQWLCGACIREKIRQAMGHADIETVINRYGHLLPNSKKLSHEGLITQYRRDLESLPESSGSVEGDK